MVRGDGTFVVWPFAEIRQTQGRLPGERLRIEFGTDPMEAVLVEEPGLADAIRVVAPDANRTLRGHGKTWRIVSWSLSTLVAAAVLYVWGSPIAADWMALRLPPSWDAGLGAGVAEKMTSGDRVCTDSVVVAHVGTVLDRLLSSAPPTPYTFRVVVLRDSSVNAFAAPGGFIAVHSGLLHATQTPEEFAGVLAHEIQHVTLRHSTRAVLREVPLRFAVSALGGGGLETGISLIGSIGALRYRRADEAEADREGMRLLDAAQVDSRAMVSFMRTLDTDRDGPEPAFVSYLSSHPQTVQRVSVLEALANARRSVAKPLLDSAAWLQVREGCH
jgi:beta-barrel assembly-enhancing protease